jgi:DNA-binding transcriptional LysR family regulator
MPSSGPPSLPDLAELRTFCAAADLGSFGRTAIRLHVSQPAISKRMQSLEATVGAQLLDRTRHGVKLTPEGRRLYEHARRLLDAADEVSALMTGIRREARLVRLASSHSAAQAFVSQMLTAPHESAGTTVELVTANSQVVRGMVADGRADLGVAASRPNHTPNPGVREQPLAADAIVCGVPPEHKWARRRSIHLDEFLAEAMVVRDPSSNARWTVDSALAECGLTAAPPLVEVPTPQSALTEARRRGAPALLSRHIFEQTDGMTIVAVEGMTFPRAYELVTPAYGEPSDEVADLVGRIRDHVRIWLR